MSNKVYIIAGARPNFMKIAPIINELRSSNIEFNLIHTGQHYDNNMSKVFFDELGIPEPNIYLNVGSGTHASQTAKIMIEFEKVILKEEPSLIVVVGDVNSTLACALVAKKRGIKIAHVEAGLRSFDQTMPEEINRLLTDQISDFLFTTERSAELNLIKEGIDKKKIFFVGNTMIDTLIKNLERARIINYYEKLNLKKKEFALVTLHRPSNVDNKENLLKVLKIVNYLQEKIKVIFPIHPRTAKNIKKFNFEKKLKEYNLITTEPIGYLEFLNLMENCRLILTDSGGIQEEASYLKVPVITLRKNTERPITVDKGSNTLVGCNYEIAVKYIDKILSNSYKKGQDIEKWDGKTAERIVSILKKPLAI